MDSIANLFVDLPIRYELDKPLAPLTWYGVGGPAKVLAHPSSVQQLAQLTQRCAQAQVPIYVLGSGANLLVADQGVDGVVVLLNDPAFRQCHIQATRVTVGAGYDLAKLVLETAKLGLSGLECMAGIPASVGGAVRMNAGGAYGDIGRSVARIQVMDQSGQVYERNRDDLVFSYRKSNITARFILEVEFELTADDPDEVMKQVHKIFTVKSSTQPLGDYSAGCAFKNPGPEAGGAAGQLIDRAGLKGFRIGQAEVSTVHANFVIAHKAAQGQPPCQAADLIAVIQHVQKTVREKLGIDLEREVVFWP